MSNQRKDNLSPPPPATPPRMQFKAFMAVTLIVLVVMGLWDFVRPKSHSNDPVEPPTAVRVAEEPNLRDAGVVDLGAIGLVSPALHVEPEKGSWQSEAFSDAATDQLKRLGKLLSNPNKLDAALTELATDDFQCGPLRPATLKSVFDDTSINVRRPVEALSGEPANAASFRGPAGLAEALRELMAPLSEATGVRSKAKVFRVSVSEDGATTAVLFELSGRNSQGDYQQKATWTCQWRRRAQGPPLLATIELVDYEESQAKSAAGPLFADCTEAVLGGNASYRQQLAYGVDHWVGRIESRYGINISGWEGIAVADVNGDGLDDLYVCQGGGLPNRLFLQKADGTAIDVSATAGVDWWDQTNSALFVDLDNDGDQDLVLGLSLGLVVMENNGQGQFSVVASRLIPEAMPFSICAADFDGDGDLDIYACCYAPRARTAKRQHFMGRPIPYHDANNAGRNVLLRNDRNWRFTDVTRRVGLDVNNRRFSLAASWEDYDQDGDMDLYVANDYGRNNLYRNDGGHFTDMAAEAGVEDISAGMSVSWGDYNGDGWMDLYVSNMWSSAGNRVTYQRQFQPTAAGSVRDDLQRHARGNSLFMNLGNGTFRDVSVTAGVTMGRWAWGSKFLDLNNDGWQDIVVANGFITQQDPGDL
ncbi:MAG: VCBS repeat-containing protein [Planctomycetes bacterium]|nr:VCBS repeat-containing protein [Planctomycetota bacterium]